MSVTMLDILRARADHICEEVIKLIGSYSGMQPANTPDSTLVFISPNGNHFWNALPPNGKQLQARMLPEVDRFNDLIRVLTQNLPSDKQQDIMGSLEKIRSAIEQVGPTWWGTPDEASNGFQELLKNIFDTLKDYCVESSNEVYAIADTNALITNPDIEHWQFENIRHFTIILTPVVLSELEKHRMGHRNQDVSDKAGSIIRKIKEYRRRGTLNNGVVIVKNKVTLRSIANEPNMAQSLSWLDPNTADDRFLATTIEVMRNNLRAEIFIVTVDINLQNKAEMAGLPFREVPDPTVNKEVG